MGDTIGKTIPVVREVWPAVQGEAGGHAYSSNLADVEGADEDTDGVNPEA